MSRYIDADDAIYRLEKLSYGDSQPKAIRRAGKYLNAFANECPADVEEVTRCKDCIYWASTLPEKERAEAANNPFSDCVCDMWESDGFTPNDFCSRGMRDE